MRSALCALVLLAGCASVAPDAPLRVLVYNIHAGKDAAGADNLERVAALIKSSDADLVMLQEVDRKTIRSGGVDQLAVLMRLTGFDGILGKSLDYQGGDYGIATLSRWPIAAQETVPLPLVPPQPRAGGSVEPRVALIVETTTPRGALTVVNTHLDASRDDRWRLQEVRELISALAQRRARRMIVGGDFNSSPDSPIHDEMAGARFRDSWLECGSGNAFTYPADRPVRRIDYLYTDGYARCSSAAVSDATPSDHRPLLVVLP